MDSDSLQYGSLGTCFGNVLFAMAHAAAFMGANLMYLKEGTRDHFMRFLSKEFPALVESYNRLYAGAYARTEYVKAVKGMIDVLQQRYDLRRRRPRSEESVPQETEDAPEEMMELQQQQLPLP